MKRSLRLMIYALFYLLIGSSIVFSQVTNTLGTDVASNAAYDDGWDNGDDGGTYFQPWNLVSSGTAGFFIGNSTTNHGDINTSSESFGMYGAVGSSADATRDFDEALTYKEQFSVNMTFSFRNGNKGLVIRDGTNELFVFNVGSDDYTYENKNGGASTSLGWAYADNMVVSFSVTKLQGTNARIVISNNQGDTFDQSFDLGTTNITSVKFYVAGTDGGGENDFFFNSLQIQETVYVSDQSGDWNTAANWTSDTVPTSDYPVRIDNSTTVTLDASVNIYRLEVMQNSTFNTGDGSGITLTVLDGGQVINDGTLSAPGTSQMNLAGSASFSHGTGASVTLGDLNANGNGTLSMTGATVAGNMTVNADVVMSSELTVTGNLIISDGASLELGTAAAQDLDVGGDYTNNNTDGSGLITNNRAISFTGVSDQNITDGSGTATFAFMLVNKASGTLFLQDNIILNGTGPGTEQVLQLLHDGTLNLNAQTMTISGDQARAIKVETSNRFITGPAGSTLQFEAGTGNGAIEGDGSLTLNGTIDFSLGKVVELGATLTLVNTTTISGASTSSYFYTSGTATLTRNEVTGSDILFPVGTASYYNPLTVNNSGTTADFAVRVDPTMDHSTDVNPVVNAFWTITADAGANATLTTQWHTDQEEAGFNRNDTYINYYDDNTSQWTGIAATEGGSDPYYTAEASPFSDFTATEYAVSSGGVLPVELTTFTAQAGDGNVILKWETKTEVNNYGFDIERSEDEKEWTKVDFVEGHGNSNSPKQYTFTDNDVKFGKYYYRLKQIDIDGAYTYTDQVEVNAGEMPGDFVLEQNYPNPFNPSTTIEFAVKEQQQATLKVYNSIGKEVAVLFNETAQPNQVYKVNFDGSQIASGVYYYRLVTGDNVKVRKMILMK